MRVPSSASTKTSSVGNRSHGLCTPMPLCSMTNHQRSTTTYLNALPPTSPTYCSFFHSPLFTLASKFPKQVHGVPQQSLSGATTMKTPDVWISNAHVPQFHSKAISTAGHSREPIILPRRHRMVLRWMGALFLFVLLRSS